MFLSNPFLLKRKNALKALNHSKSLDEKEEPSLGIFLFDGFLGTGFSFFACCVTFCSNDCIAFIYCRMIDFIKPALVVPLLSTKSIISFSASLFILNCNSTLSFFSAIFKHLLLQVVQLRQIYKNRLR